MKTDALFDDLKKKDNVTVLKPNAKIVDEFHRKYENFQDTFFYEQFVCSGGIVIDNWIRIFGCGALNVVEKNRLYNQKKIVDIFICEDVLGGLFGLKDNIVYYFAPDANNAESLNIYYTQFLNWIINNPLDVHKFYQLYRWNTWKKDCENIKLTEGFSFYPLLQISYDIEKRSKKIISIDELIRLNLGI